MNISRKHAAAFQSAPLADEVRERMEQTAAESIQRQREVEAADEIGFDEFLRNWNA